MRGQKNIKICVRKCNKVHHTIPCRMLCMGTNIRKGRRDLAVLHSEMSST